MFLIFKMLQANDMFYASGCRHLCNHEYFPQDELKCIMIITGWYTSNGKRHTMRLLSLFWNCQRLLACVAISTFTSQLSFMHGHTIKRAMECNVMAVVKHLSNGRYQRRKEYLYRSQTLPPARVFFSPSGIDIKIYLVMFSPQPALYHVPFPILDAG